MKKTSTITKSLWHNFLGHSPLWYKNTIVFFLILNPLLLCLTGKTLTSWAILVEFIVTLSLTLKCYPLQPGGLIVLQSLLLGLTTPDLIYKEVLANSSVIFLLIFMLSSVYFMKDLLLFLFTEIIIKITNKIALSLTFLILAAFLSAFLDALTVMAIIITALYSCYTLYQNTQAIEDKNDLEQFRKFLRSIIMHGAVGTTIGGALTIIGEPQNLLVAQYTKWHFIEYLYNMAPITVPVFVSGIAICIIVEKFKLFGYGCVIPAKAYDVLLKHYTQSTTKSSADQSKLIVQAIVAIILIFSLAFHIAEIGLIGLGMLILLTSFNGVTDELQLGNAFKEALPFTSLIVVFFAIISVILQQHLFQPLIDYVLSLSLSDQPPVFYLFNGLLSSISDNVFVASIYITQVFDMFTQGIISQEQFSKLAIAINMGTNIPSMATPNGQAAFLFLLASTIAPLIRLSYWRMIVMAFPYTICLTFVGLWFIMYI